MRFWLLFLLTASMALAALPASALNVPSPPSGMCNLDTAQDADRNALSYMHIATQGEGAELKALFAPCHELEYLRVGRLNFLSHYAVLMEQKSTLPEGISQSEALAVLTATSGISGSFSSQPLRPQDTIAATAHASYHGVLGQSPKLLIVGSEQRHVVHKREYLVAAVSAITMIGGKIVTMNFYAPAGNDTFKQLTGRAEAYGNALLAANP